MITWPLKLHRRSISRSRRARPHELEAIHQRQSSLPLLGQLAVAHRGTLHHHSGLNQPVRRSERQNVSPKRLKYVKISENPSTSDGLEPLEHLISNLKSSEMEPASFWGLSILTTGRNL